MNLKTWWQHCWLPACLLLLVAITHTVSSETRVVCYYTNWSVYRPGTAKFSPQNINPYLCTHLIYAFGGFTKENSLKPFDKYQDIEKGGYAKFTGLKTYNKNLKTMLAIGGWNEGSSRFSPMVANADRRKELVKNAVKFLRQNHFDGLDLDWEYPSFRDGGKTRDKVNYAQLVQELREEFDKESEKTGRPRLLLTMAVPAGIEYINKGYDIPKLNKYLDWMNILSYDYHSAFEPAVNHHSPLYPLEEDNEYNFDGDLNIDHTIKHYLKLGADSSKLVLGIPTYGRSYTLFNPDANELGAPADGPGDMGDATRENGYLAYYEICENLKENDWKVVQPNPDAMGPYAYKDNQWVSYDDELIVKKKSVYVAENNLGGIMFWSIDNDDFRGNCYNKPYPLIEAAKEALITAASRQTEDNLVKPRKPIQRSRRPTSPKKESDTSSTRVQNSGGRQSLDEVPASGGRKRIRPTSRSKSRSEDTAVERKEERKRIRQRGSGRRRKTTTTTAATTVTSTTPSTLPTTPMYKTPEPPTTPDPGGDFKCEEDGFFPHPRDCKKYFWCLSGPADLGIIAHQFTCPAGLYFNKAADSCDYTQNVLCNKKLKTPSTTSTTPVTTSTTTTTAAPTTTTRRAPQRITAATSRTTFLYTSTSTTTEEPEYYDEYEYEDEDLEEDAPRRGEPDSEEDPRVIKELIDLIKKVGGVEELEKFLKLQEDGSMAVTHSGSTTPASISRSLYERVLQSRANAGKTNTVSSKSQNSLVYSTITRNRPSSQNEGLEKPETASENPIKRGNSRFTPQNEGLEKPDTANESGAKRGRPQYTTITRQRASTERTAEADNEPEDEEIDDEDLEEEVQTKKTRQFPSRKQTTPEYVTIRRTRPTSATEPEIEDEDTPTRSSILRSRQRGVPGETDEDENEATSRPEYVTIRRNRPPTEEVTTSKYTTIQRKRPSTESSDDAETTDIESSKRRSTTQSPNEVSLEKEKRYRSTTLATTDEATSTITTLNTDTTVEDTKRTTTDKETEDTKKTTTDKEATSTVTENIEVKSTSEETTDSTAEKTATQTLATELPTTLESSTELPTTDKSNQISEVTSEKNSPSPQLFRPRPFATRTRSTTTSKSTETTESPTKKVSEPSGTKPGVPGRPIVRKFQPGNRFRSQTQNTQTQIDVSSNNDRANIRTTTEENGVNNEEIDAKQREEEYRRRIANRGRSKFTLPTSTFEPTVARRRRPQHQAVTEDYEFSDYEEVQRTYRPTLLADLSSLTSADIAFRRDNNRRHIRRRPVPSQSVTSTTTTTEGPTEPSLKTGPRTLTLARKQISESAFGRNSRRINQKPTESSTTEINTFNEPSPKPTLFGKPRPAYSTLLRTTTTQKLTTEPEPETTTLRSKYSEAPPLVRTTDTNNEITEFPTTEPEPDSTESNSDKEYKTLKPESEVTENPQADVTVSSTTEVQEQSPVTIRIRSTTAVTDGTTERSTIRRLRPIVTSESPEAPKINRTRKVFIANRRRPTTPISTETESSNTETIRTTVDFKRQRPAFLSSRNNQTSITRLKPVQTQGDPLETNTTSESNRGLVKRIRPIGSASKIDEEEKIKLSETNISEHGYLGPVQNLPEDDSGKYRRRKIVRRIRPSKDTIFSKTEEDELKSRRIKISDKSVLTTEELPEEGTTLRVRGRGRFLDSTTIKDDLESETQLNKRIRPGNDSLFSKSESIDILRSKRIRINGQVESETEIEEDESTDDQSYTSTTDSLNLSTESDQETTKKRPISSLYKPSNDFRNRRLKLTGSTKQEKINDEEVESETENEEDESTDNQSYTSTTDSLNLSTESQGTTKKRPIPSLYKPSNDFRNRRFKLTGSVKQETIDDEEDQTNKRLTTTAETPSTFRPRNLIRKFRPGTDNANIKFIENNRATNRTRKIIRRLRPTTTTTTEAEIPQSTITEIPSVSTTTENIIVTTDLPEEEIVPTTEVITETTEYSLTTIDDTDETTIFTTEAETTTTTTTRPRPTRPSLIGRSRPAYRPRGRPVVEIRSTTPGILPASFRRKFNGLNRNESTDKQDETEDGIIDSKLKRLYGKKQKYTPNVRSTTERRKVEEEEEKAISEEKEAITTTTTTTTEDSASESSTEKQVDTTIIDQTEAVTTEESTDLTTTPEENEISTIFTTDPPTTILENIQPETETEPETKSTTVSRPTESTTLSTTPESTAENTESITESNTEFVEIPTTEFVVETTPEEISEKSTTQETSTSETTTNIDNTSTATENDNRQESERPYKPIRYKPSDRPKLRINLNRTETDSDRNDNDEPRNRKFIPSRTADQRNRSKLAYRKDSTTEKPKDVSERAFVPRGKKLERPEDDNDEEEETENKDLEEVREEIVETKPERTHYPTLKPVSEKFNFFRKQNEDTEEYDEGYEGEVIDDEDEEEEEEPEPEPAAPLENPIVKYLQTIRNNQEVIKTTLDQPEDNLPQEEPPVEEEEEDEEYEDTEDEEEVAQKNIDQSTKFNIPLVNRPIINRPPIPNQPNIPTRTPNRPQYAPNRPVIPNEPRRPAISSGNRPFNPNEINRPIEPNRPIESNRPIEPNRPIETNSPIETNRPIEPNRSGESNRPVELNRPSVNRPAGGRNYPRRFNKPVNPTSSSTTTESLAGINLEAVNARNKNLYSKNRKANIPHPGPVSTTLNDTLTLNDVNSTSTTSSLSTVETTTTTSKLEISQVTEETIIPEPTTEQLSTLHHVFAEPDIPTTPLSTSSGEITSLSPEYTTKYNFTAAQIEAARSLERVIEINRIVEVSLKEDKVKNSSGVVETRVMLEKVPTFDRIGAINRVTVIKVVDGNNETETSNVPSNHAVTLNEIVTGKRIDTSQKIDIVAKLHAPDIDLTKMNILNNTLEIIETQRRDDESKEETTTTVLPTVVTEIIPDGIPVHVVNGPKILDQIINDTVLVGSNQNEKKFEINSKSNVIDYSHRELSPIQIIASAQPADNQDSKQGRKLAIDSKSVVVNNHNVRPVFTEATTLPLEALFQTDSPDYNILKEFGVTQLPTLKEVVTGRGNYIDDDQDLLESRNINGRVRIRILGQDNDYTQHEPAKDPVFAPIRLLNEEETKSVTLKADVVEITQKPVVDTIKIAPIEVSLSQPQTVRVPVVRVESSQSSSAERSLKVKSANSVPLKRESPTYFNPEPSRPFFFRRPSLRFPPGKATLSSTAAPSTTTTPRPVRSPPRRRFTTRENLNNATAAGGVLGTSASQQVIVSTTPKPRFKFAPRRPYLKPSTTSTESTSTTTEEVEASPEEDDNDTLSNDDTDQMIESSIQRVKSHEHQDNSILDLQKQTSKDGKNQGKDKGKDSLEEIGDIGLSLSPLKQAPLPSRRRTNTRSSTTSTTDSSVSTEKVLSPFERLRTRQRTRISTTVKPQPSTTSTTTTTTPAPPAPRNTLRRRRPQPQPFERVTQAPIIITTGSYKPITIEYDYYDEGDVRILGQLPANSKVLIHASGVIQCLDQGNFPHPVSCKKFISCAKMENGDVIGWEYTCPNRLSFDPVGGICNWSAGLGCKE